MSVVTSPIVRLSMMWSLKACRLAISLTPRPAARRRPHPLGE